MSLQTDNTQVRSGTNQIIQGLWIGPELSLMEQLSISSFLQNGHDYHLYVYDNVRHIPVGTVVKDASEILPSSRIFQYKESPSYAGFSNFFRYKLLLERGGLVGRHRYDLPEAVRFSRAKKAALRILPD